MYTTANQSYGSYFRKGQPTSRHVVHRREESREEETDTRILERLQRQEYLAAGVYDDVPDSEYTIPALHAGGQQGSSSTSRTSLDENLDRFGMYEIPVRGDGNCQFRAISYHMFRTPDLYADVREETVEYMGRHRDLFLKHTGEGPEAFDAYLARMSRDREWGDHLTLQAAADLYKMRICVITSHRVTDEEAARTSRGMLVQVRPRDPHTGCADESLATREVWVSFLTDQGAEHYNPLAKE
eukprot:TRINITY_DN11362_c0_g1_i1.p1 TRINITY_DN11362_c0_g1~~TRINITY_DN11362_c0_g1_i1.p1  ORF type:complete len:241 (+),score=92.81 TRINITY_DN11362_c0_g1_i1:108-830(+)